MHIVADRDTTSRPIMVLLGLSSIPSSSLPALTSSQRRTSGLGYRGIQGGCPPPSTPTIQRLRDRGATAAALQAAYQARYAAALQARQCTQRPAPRRLVLRD